MASIWLGGNVQSYEDAQGFRVGPEQRRVRARATGARMFHYGWAGPSQAVQRKLAASKEIFTEAVDRLEARAARRHALDWTPLLRPFRGTHPGGFPDGAIAADLIGLKGQGLGPS